MGLRCSIFGHKTEIISDVPSKERPERDRVITVGCKRCSAEWVAETTGAFATPCRRVK